MNIDREEDTTLTIKDTGLLRSEAIIDSRWVGSDSGRTFAERNPANGEVIVEIARCGGAEAGRAIANDTPFGLASASTPATSAASGGWRRGWSMASSGPMKG